jgi:hypothetical protein
MYDMFTDRSRMVMNEARDEARRLKSSHLGTEHLLLGMILGGDCVAAQVLKGQGVDPEAVVREALTITVSPPDMPTPGQDLIVLTPRCKGALDKAEHEAARLRHDYIGTEHLLLGLLLEEESVALQVLIALDKDPGKLRSETLRLIGSEDPRRTLKPVPLLSPDQIAVMRHAMQAGLGSVPVFARAFGLTLSEIEKVMDEIRPKAAERSSSSASRLGLSIEVSADAGGQISEIKKEFAVLANRLGVTVHGELNDELCMACPGEQVARVYMKKRTPTPKPEPKLEWETLYSPDHGNESLERWPVPRGWIYRSTQWTNRDHDDPGPSERTESMTTVQA